MIRKTRILILLALLTVAGAAAVYYSRDTDLQPLDRHTESHEFSGEVLSVDGNNILMKGTFVVPDRPDLLAASYLREATATVNAHTRITRIIRFLTPPDTPTSGPIFMKDNRSEESVVDLQTFGADATRYNVYIRALSPSDIYDSRTFGVDEIRYEFRLIESFDEVQ